MAEKPTGRPPRATEAHLRFLDDLRESGVVNVFGAGPYLEEVFGLNPKAAREVLAEWMRTFAARHPSRGGLHAAARATEGGGR